MGFQIATTYTQANPYRVLLEVRPDLAAHPDALDKIFVGSTTSAQVPLSAVTKLRPTATALSVNHQGQLPSTTLSFNLAPGATLSQAVLAIEKARLAIGLPATVQGNPSASSVLLNLPLSAHCARGGPDGTTREEGRNAAGLEAVV